jgi:flagellar hook-length control protein FliK
MEGDSAAPSTDTATTAPTDKAADDGTASASKDANALALAMFAQAFAASLGIAPAAAQSATANASSTALDGATQGVTDTTRSSSSGSLQELVSLLAQDLAADGQGKSDADASRSDVATTTRSPGGSTPDTGAAGSNSVGPSLAQLGTASHFSLQHTQTDTNTGELKSSVGSAAWTDELGGQLTWMTHKGLESGSLRLSPEHLGPVEVRIAVQNGDASVWFGANHPDTRAALEQALPRLREMFANQGLTLTDSGVSRESPRQSPPSSPQSIAAVSAVGSSDVSVSAAVRISLGLVDTYA